MGGVSSSKGERCAAKYSGLQLTKLFPSRAVPHTPHSQPLLDGSHPCQ